MNQICERCKERQVEVKTNGLVSDYCSGCTNALIRERDKRDEEARKWENM